MSVKAEMSFGLKLASNVPAGANAEFSWGAAMAKFAALKNGNMSNMYQFHYVEERTVASGGVDSIDLSGSLLDPLGQAILAADIVLFALINEAKDETANSTSLTIGGGSNAVSGFGSSYRPIEPGGMFVKMSANDNGVGKITAGTGDTIRITNGSGAPATYQIAVLMRSDTPLIPSSPIGLTLVFAQPN